MLTTKEYLTSKSIAIRENNGELITRCVFNDCDKDSKGTEAHLYLNAETGQYQCKKCGAEGNLTILMKHFGDNLTDIQEQTTAVHTRKAKIDTVSVDKYHSALPDRIRKYLNSRGISDRNIDLQKLGYGKFYGKNYITIPIKDMYGGWYYFKLREDPDGGSSKMTSQKGVEAQLFEWRVLKSATDRMIICEGEMDCMALHSHGIPAITSTHGAGSFKKEWVNHFNKNQKIYICFDNDEAGRKGSLRTADFFVEAGMEVYIITLPNEVGEGCDITDYIIKLKGSTDDLFTKYAKPYPERIDISKIQPLKAEDLTDILGLTIKDDVENKLATFLCQLSAYTDSSQFNISFNAPSSTGKSYIPTEIARLFPQEDVMEIAYCSPTAFFHDAGEYDKDKELHIVDLRHKILIFLDQPHNDLLARLRPVLSHDKPEIILKITDKNQKSGLRTKTILIKGYPAVIFCTAGLNIDEQEATRFLLLSPEVTQAKIKQGITATILKEADSDSFKAWLDSEPKRTELITRIRGIKLEKVSEIKIPDYQRIQDKFLQDSPILKPRHQRDIKRLLALVKMFALLNVWFREREGSIIKAHDSDIDAAFTLWDKLSPSQELNLPPYVLNLFNEIIMPTWQEKGELIADPAEKPGLTRKELMEAHFKVYGRRLDPTHLRQQILPMLETAGLVLQEPDLGDKRQMLITPILSGYNISERNSVNEGGVNEEINNNEIDKINP